MWSNVRMLGYQMGFVLSRFLHDFSGLACWEPEKVSNSKVRCNKG